MNSLDDMPVNDEVALYFEKYQIIRQGTSSNGVERKIFCYPKWNNNK